MGEEQQIEVPLGRRHIIERPRLTQLLDETSARVIMLVAPAGYGKTTLARQWLADHPHAWYQATPASADIAALALGILGSTAGLIPDAGRHLREWLPTSPEPESEIDVIADLLIDELKALPRDSWLVLDDVHLLASEASETILRLVVESGTSPVLITSRIRPPWVSARDLLYGRYFELGQSTLAMNFDETNAVLKSADSEAAHGLIALADGWPAVIGLAALSPTPVNFAQDVPQTLHDYFAEEIYNALELSVRETLSCLAIHRTVTRDFAEAVMGSEAVDALGCGISAGFFPVSSRAELEFHPLLHSFFRNRFDELPQERIDTTLNRAIEVLIDNGAWDDAFWLIEEFQEFDLLESFLAKALEPLTQEGRLSTLRAWLAFGRKHRSNSPYVDLLDAELSFRAGLYHRAGLLACRSAVGFIADEPLQSLAYYRAGQCKHFTNAPREALALFEKAGETARTEGRVRDALWGQFIAAFDVEEEDPKRMLTEFSELGTENPDSIVRAATGRLILGYRTGNLSSAIRAGSSGMEMVDDVTDPLIRSSFWNGLCAALSLAGRYEEAIRTASAAAREMDRSHTAFSRYHTLSVTVFAHAGLKRYAQAKSTLAEIVDYATAVGDLYLLAMAELHQMRLSLYEGRPEASLESLTDVQLDVDLPALEAEFLATRAAALTCLGETGQALKLCDRAEKLSGWIEPRLLVSWARVLALLTSNPSCAGAAVKSTFEMTSREGADDVCVFAWRVNPLILTLLQGQPETHSNLVRILRNSGDAHLIPQLRGRAATAHSNLTVRESEVYELLAEGKSNREIAAALVISEVTAKVHVRHILQKLGVRNRTEAAVRAKARPRSID